MLGSAASLAADKVRAPIHDQWEKQLIFHLDDQGESERVTGGSWDLSSLTLRLEYGHRIHPHENSMYVLFDGVRELEGRFRQVILPDGDLCDLIYEPEKGRITASNFRPRRPPAFPGAEGFGKYTIGGRGGSVYTVTTLADGGPGSLREALEAQGPRTVVFNVSGTIALKSPIRIRNPYLTVAGQTAPGDGICIRDYQVSFETDHLIFRHLRFRPGDTVPDAQHDGFGGDGSFIVVDHCSVSWSIDEAFSINKSANVTVQWCMVTESLYQSSHKKGRHGYGGLWGGPGASYHHNILAHHSSRNPRASGNQNSGLLDYRNNVIFNWGFNSAYGGELWPRNWINNYYKAGPATGSNVRNRIFIQKDPRGRMYADGNFIFGFPEISADNWKGGIHFHPEGEASEATLRARKPYVVAPVTTHTADQAYELVLRHAGASLRRDSVDSRIIEEIRTGTARHGASYGGGGKGIIDSPADVGGWPELRSLPAPVDSDGDGMPDEWEKAHGLNPRDARDGAFVSGNDGYTNLERYLNSLVPAKNL